MSVRSLLRALLLATLAVAVLSTHGFVGFDAVRVKAVRVPVEAASGLVRVSLTGLPRLARLRAPFAVIARIRNASNEGGRFSIAVDQSRACERGLGPGVARRIDCAVAKDWDPAVEHVVIVQGPFTPWRLEYLELATHHGNTTGAISLLVLPGSSDQYMRPSGSSLFAAWVALIAILLVPSCRPARWVRWLHALVAGTVVILFVIVQCSQWVTDYRVVLSAGTFLRLLILLVVLRLWFAVRWLLQRRNLAGCRSIWIPVARAALVGVLTVGIYGAVSSARLQDYSGNYSGFLRVSEKMFDRNPLLNTRQDVRRSLVLDPGGGYDAQFVYFALFDPFLRAYRETPSTYRRVMDAAPYRYGRTGFSLLTYAFAGGQWQRYPATMVWLILVSLGVSAALLAFMADVRGMTPAFGLLVILIPGFWQSLQAALPEPIAAAALLAGLLCLWRGHCLVAGGLFAVSLLTRETGIVAVGCALAAAAAANRRQEVLVAGLTAMGAVLLWRLYVAWILFPDWGMEGLLFRPPDLDWPFRGILGLWRMVARGQYFTSVPEISRAAIAYPCLLIAGFLLTAALLVVAPNPTNVAGFVYAMVAVSLNFDAIWVHVGNGQRGTYEMFLMLALSCLPFRTYSRAIRVGLIAFWVLAAAYVFFLTFDASYIRASFVRPL